MEWSADGELALDVVRCLGDAATSASALAAIVRGGSSCLPLADLALQGELVVERAALFQFVRACRSINSEAAHELLRRHARHPERDIGLAALRALASISVADGSRDAAIARDLLRDDVEHAARVLAALRSVAVQKSAEVLRSALSDELELLKRRALACLSLIYGRAELERVQLQLDQPSASDRALAMEWLDVTLSNEDRLVLVLIEPGITVDDQWRRLSRSNSIATMSAEDALRDLVNDPTDVWRQPWLVACALVAATGFEKSIEGLRPNESQPIDHDHIVRETIVGIRRRGDGNWP